MRPRMLGMLASLHLLGALAIFAATLWIGSHGAQAQPQQQRTAAQPRPARHGAAAASLALPAPSAQSARSSAESDPDWLRQARERELAPVAWQR